MISDFSAVPAHIFLLHFSVLPCYHIKLLFIILENKGNVNPLPANLFAAYPSKEPVPLFLSEGNNRILIPHNGNFFFHLLLRGSKIPTAKAVTAQHTTRASVRKSFFMLSPVTFYLLAYRKKTRKKSPAWCGACLGITASAPAGAVCPGPVAAAF